MAGYIYEKHHWGDNGIPMPIGSVPVPRPFKGAANGLGRAVGAVADDAKEGAWNLTKTAVGKTAGAGIGLAKWGAVETGRSIAELGKETTQLAGTALIGGAHYAGKALSSKTARKFYKAVGRDVGNLAKSMVTYTPEHLVHDARKGTYEKIGGRMKFSKKGLVAIAAASLIGGSIKAGQDIKASNMGTIDSHPTTATPDYMPKQYERHPSRSYLDNAGATGDLVFALNALRH